MKISISNFIKKTGFVSFGLCLFLSGLVPSAIANRSVANRPVTDDPPPNTRGRSAGSRGCSLETASGELQATDIPALILLAPNVEDISAEDISAEDISAEDIGSAAPDTLAKTISTQPTFAWFNRDSSETAQTVFRLYEYDSAAQRYQLLVENKSDAAQGKSGIVTASLADDMPSLSVGSRYLWQVGLICDANRPSGDLFAEAEFEVMAASSALTSQLADTSSSADKAAMLAAEGLWYDALPLIFGEIDGSLSDADTDSMPSVREALFEQVSFSDAEMAQLKDSSVYRVEISGNDADSSL